MNTNLYRIDDVLLRAGAVAVLVSTGILWLTIQNLHLSGLGTALVLILVALACPPTLLIAGWIMRRREKQVVELWRLVEAHGQLPVNHAREMSSFSRRELIAAIRRINRRGGALLIWDEAAGLIRNESRGKTDRRMTHSEDCSSCGGRVNIEVSTESREYVCPYCGSGLDSENINALLGKLHDRDSRQAEPAPLSMQTATQPRRSSFRMGIFVLLLIVCWPGAVFYAIKANS